MPQGGELTITTGVRRYRTRRSLVDVSIRDTGRGHPARPDGRRSSTRSSRRGPWEPGWAAHLGTDRAQAGGVVTAKNNPREARPCASRCRPAEPPGKPEE